MNKEWSQSLRINLEYIERKIILKSWSRINKRSPQTDPIGHFEGEFGWWITLNDHNGNVLYRQIINNPLRAHKEVFAYDKEEGVSWELPDKPEMKWNFTILLPDIPEATSMSMYGSLDELEDASGPSKEIFTIELRVEELREEINAFMMARDAGEGGVISIEKIVDKGQSSECWNIVLLSEGYRGDELATFHEHAGSFVNRLRRFTPFDELWNFINIHLINVASIDSGMADPNDLDDNPRTFFDARFYNFTINDRLIVDDQNLAQRVVNQHIPEFDLVMMIINTPLFGGSGGSVSVFSSHPLSSKIGIHEMGHTAFGLADEYEFPGSNGRIGEIYDGPPRSEPNIATSILVILAPSIR